MQPNYLAKVWRTRDLPPQGVEVVVMPRYMSTPEFGYYDHDQKAWYLAERGVFGNLKLSPAEVVGWWPIPAIPTNETTAQQPSDWVERCSSAVEGE